jgi:hypothetical protein
MACRRLGVGFKSKASSKGYEIILVIMGTTLKIHWNIIRKHWEIGNTLRIPRSRKFSKPPSSTQKEAPRPLG